MKVLYVFLVLLLAMTQNSFAGPRTRQQAMQIAQNKAQSLGVVLSMPTQARRSAAMGVVSDEVAPYFVFNNGSNQGWTIVSGDDRMPEVLGYSDSGTLDLDNLPAPVLDLFSGFELMYNNLGTAETTSTSAVGPRKTGTTNLAIGPLLTTSWSQFSPYYNLTPTSSGTHTATCCVATALAQILYYLYYTQGGQSSTTFTNSISVNGRTASAPRTYDWSSMLPSYLGEYTDAQATAVATLMRDCGYALSVTYGVSESTAYTSAVTSVGPTYFGLASGASYNNCSSATAFFSAIDTELNNYRPCQVVGNGHSFVCDGRSADGNYYHFNFGYGGGDGFYCAGAYNGYDQYSDMAVATGLRLAGSSSSSTAKQGLEVAYNSAIKTAGNRPVGTIPGMYQLSYYNTLKGYLDTAKGVINGTTTMTDANIKTLINNIGTAEQNLIAFPTPFNDTSKNTGSTWKEYGTPYYIRTYASYSGSRYGMYYNTEGTTVTTSLYPVSDSWSGYRYRLIYDSSSNGYYIGDNTLKQYFANIPSYGSDLVTNYYGTASTMPSSSDVPCEVIATDYLGNGEFALTMRPMGEGYKDDHCRYITAWNGTSSVVASASVAPDYVYGGDPYGDYYCKWILVPTYNTNSSSGTVPTVTTGTASFTNSDVKLEVGGTYTQGVTANNRSGTKTFSSSDLTVATVDPTTGEVTAVGEGTATITVAIGATAEYFKSGYSAAVATYSVAVTNSAKQDPTASFTTKSYTVNPGQTITNKFTTNSNGAVTYSSNASGVATVDASTGLVTAVDEGTATITASVAATDTYNAATASFTVTVKRNDQKVSFAQPSLSLVAGNTAQNVASTTGDGTITYYSSDESVATVASDGTVTALAVGTATITATAAQTNKYHSASATYTVTVTEDATLRAKLNALIAQAEGMFTASELSAAQTAASQAGTPITGNAASSITTNEKYLIAYVSGSTITYMTSTGKSTTNKKEAGVFTLTTSGTTCYIQNSDGNYLQVNTSSGLNTGLKFSSTKSTSNFTYQFNGNQVQFYFTSGNNKYYLKKGTNNYYIATNTGSSTLTLFPVTGSYEAASAEQTTLIALATAITTANAVTTATQSDIDALAAAIAAYLPYKGDVNLDGTIDVADVSALITILRGNTLSGGQGKTDIDGSGTPDVNDVRALVNKILMKKEE